MNYNTNRGFIRFVFARSATTKQAQQLSLASQDQSQNQSPGVAFNPSIVANNFGHKDTKARRYTTALYYLLPIRKRFYNVEKSDSLLSFATSAALLARRSLSSVEGRTLREGLLTLQSVLWIMIFTTGLHAQNPNLGTVGAQFLKIPTGARSAALSGAVTGMSIDAAALFWNPAGIAQDHTHAFHFSHTPHMTFFDVTAIGYTLSSPKYGTVGLQVLAMGMEKMEITTEFQPDGTGEFFDSQDLQLGVSYARKLIDQFSVGVTLKYIRQRIWHETATSMAFDCGTHYNIEFNHSTIAMSMRNFGQELRFEGSDLITFYDPLDQYPNRLIPTYLQTENYALPLIFQFGLATDLLQTPFLHSRLALDATHYNDQDEEVLVGLETIIAQRFILRGGYKFNNADERGSLGVGLHHRVDDVIIKLDYAYVLHEYLEDTQFISVDLIF